MTLKKFAPWKIQADDRFELSDISTRLPVNKKEIDETFRLAYDKIVPNKCW